MSGYVASALQSSLSGKTVMALDRNKGSGSLRGELAFYWRDKLKHLEYLTIGGHAKFCGVSLSNNISPDTLVEDITKLL